jgi:hypothetical protein
MKQKWVKFVNRLFDGSEQTEVETINPFTF